MLQNSVVHRLLLVSIGLTASFAASTPAAQADDSPKALRGVYEEASQEKPSIVRVFQLKHLDPHETMSTLRGVLSGSALRGAVDDRTNSVIITADQETMQQAEDLIQVLEDTAANAPVEDSHSESEPDLVYFEFPAGVSELAAVANSVYNVTDGCGTFEIVGGRLLVVSAEDDDCLKRVEELIGRYQEILRQTSMDSGKKQNYELSFFLLGLDLDNVEVSYGSQLPKALQGVGAALAENGFQSVRLIAPLSVPAVARVPLPSTGFAKGQPKGTRYQVSGSTSQFSRIMCEGLIRVAEDGLALTVQATVAAPRENAPKPSTAFALSTSLTIKPDEYYVLAVSPTSTNVPNLALVVRASLRK